MPKDLGNLFGERLRQCRKGRGFTPFTLGERAELTVAEVERLERGELRPDSDAIVRLADGLEMPIGVLRVWAAPIDVHARFGENLRRCREEGGLSQAETALRGSFNWATISIWEAGKRLPRVDSLVTLCGALGVSATELLRGTEWPRE